MASYTGRARAMLVAPCDNGAVDHATPTLVQRGEARVAEALAALPPGVQRALSARRPVRIDGDELDPGIQLLLRVRELRGRPSLIRGPDAAPADERANLRREIVALVRKPTPVAAVHELEVEGAGAALPARHYVPPERGGPHPLLVFLHGGGWTIGDLDTHDEPSRLLCRNAGVHVLSVGYRLAPEHGFPVPVEDALAAWRWAHANASRLGAD